jgi:hypothetical protein
LSATGKDLVWALVLSFTGPKDFLGILSLPRFGWFSSVKCERSHFRGQE